MLGQVMSLNIYSLLCELWSL